MCPPCTRAGRGFTQPKDIHPPYREQTRSLQQHPGGGGHRRCLAASALPGRCCKGPCPGNGQLWGLGSTLRGPSSSCLHSLLIMALAKKSSLGAALLLSLLPAKAVCKSLVPNLQSWLSFFGSSILTKWWPQHVLGSSPMGPQPSWMVTAEGLHPASLYGLWKAQKQLSAVITEVTTPISLMLSWTLICPLGPGGCS